MAIHLRDFYTAPPALGGLGVIDDYEDFLDAYDAEAKRRIAKSTSEYSGARAIPRTRC
jgi:hypothetical protein